MMANLIFRQYLSEKDKVLALANSILEAHIGDEEESRNIEAFVVKIVVSKDSFDWYLRFDGDPDKPLRCSLKGKRKTTTKITVSGGNSPTLDNSPTGCHQGLSYN